MRRFQEDERVPFFVLSLKAGGAGLNLTAASHVVHFDRWWNPAVENQATDRAFRIGQTKNVLVHKFVCRGTVEEKIDQLIDSKRQLSQDLLEGGGDVLLTEMKDDELLKLVALDLHTASRRVRMDYDGYGFRPYVSVAARRAQAARELAKLRKKGRKISPVAIEGRTIARTFWGEAWCDNLERYSDYANRLPRGRTYVRNGSVVDLQVAPGRDHGARQRLDDVRREGDGGPVRERAGMPSARTARALSTRSSNSSGTLLQGRDGAALRAEDGAVPVAEGDHLHLQLSGLGVDVQARRGGAVRDRRATGSSARAALHAPQGRSARFDCEGGGRSLGEGQATSWREGARE